MADVEKLKITLGVKTAMAVIGAVAVSSVATITYINRIDNRLGELISDRYGIARAAEVALRMAIENPGLRVPDPRDPNSIIVVGPRTVP